MTDPIPTRRRFYPTPAWLIFGLLVVEGLLWLSERYTVVLVQREEGLDGADRRGGGRRGDAVHAALVHRGPGLPMAVPVLDSVAAGADGRRGYCRAVGWRWR